MGCATRKSPLTRFVLCTSHGSLNIHFDLYTSPQKPIGPAKKILFSSMVQIEELDCGEVRLARLRALAHACRLFAKAPRPMLAVRAAVQQPRLHIQSRQRDHEHSPRAQFAAVARARSWIIECCNMQHWRGESVPSERPSSTARCMHAAVLGACTWLLLRERPIRTSHRRL